MSFYRLEAEAVKEDSFAGGGRQGKKMLVVSGYSFILNNLPRIVSLAK
jgi:hypothetical protein